MENMHAALSGPVYPPEEGRTRPRTDRDLKIQRATIPNSVSGQPTAHPPGGVLNSHPLNQPPNITLNERLRNEMNVCRSDASNALYISVKNSHGTISPLPPALSPASLSPANSSNFNSSRASPAPPVIADEDELPPSLPYSSALPNRPTAPPNLTSSVDVPSKSTDYEPFEKRTRIRTPSSSCTSESTSSSSSTSSSCEDVPLRQSHTNGIPILEKMSVSLIAPKVESTKISPTVSSPAQNSPAAVLIDSPRRPVAAKVATVCSPTKEAAPTDGPTLPADEAKTEVKVDLSTEQKAAASQVTAKKRRAPAKRKRAVAKRWKRDSESDFEFDGRLGPRRAKSAVTLVKSVKEKAKRTSRNAKGKTESKLPSGAELASRRRYLESPFFCLCQSSSSSEALGVSGSCGGSGEATKDVLCDLPSSMPAHVVNPALKDCSSAFYSLGDPRVTSLCPLLQEQNAGRAGVGNKNALCGGAASFVSDRTANSELQSFFANSFYKPTLRPNVRDTRLPSTYSDSACGAWCCVFCGEDPDFLLMGPLYGPYFLAEPTASKLLAQQTGDTQQQSAALSAIPSDLVITPSSPRKSMTSNSEVVSSAVTRSSAAAANPARPVVAANTGGLRLVIKALSPTLTGSVVVSSVKSSNSGGSSNSSVAGRGRKSGANGGRKSGGGGRRAKSAAQPPAPAPSPPPPAPTRLRIGLGGEVWFHFECVLWASGTSIHGDGTISGLEDVVSMALEAACSHCKKPGPILSCRSRGCGLCYHFNCARLAECHFNTEQFTVLCKKHFVYS
ncbi:hypothetical protein AAHC03_020918 [Spirometra sp. Aus1]